MQGIWTLPQWTRSSYIYTGWWFQTFFIFHFIYGMSSFPLTNSYFSRWAQTLHHQLDTSRYTISPGYAGWPNDRWRHGKGNQPDFFSIYWVFIGYTGLPHLRYSMLIGGDWNHGIWLDFPETVGNGIMIPTDDSSIIFQRGRSTTNHDAINE